MKTLLIILLTLLVVKTTFGQGFWNKSATIRSDGVMEIGKYIDFHETNSDPNDYSIRLYSNNGILGLNGSFNIYGDLNLSSGLITSNKLLLNDPNDIDNWNNLWQCGFFQGYNIVNAPESSGWFWGINMGHNGNSSTHKHNGQIAIKNDYDSPTMYFRSTAESGEGVWAKVLNDNGNQQINGNLTVAGKLLSREVKVTIDAGADFVFDKNYKLTELEQIEKYIKEHNHLPGIQSEEVMKKEGLNMNEFQMKLLQKIEELTLHTIEQDKKINELQEIIDRNGMK